MKLKTTLSALAFFASISVSNAYTAYDGMNYTPGDIDGAGISWTPNGSGRVNAANTSNPSLPSDYGLSTQNGYLESATGAGGFATNSSFASISFNTPGTYYASWILGADVVGASVQNYLSFQTSGFAEIFKIGLNNSANLIVGTSTGSALSAGDHLILAKFDITNSGNDTISATAFAAGSNITSEPVAWDVTYSADITSTYGLLLWKHQNQQTWAAGTNQLDEFRMGDTFTDVTGVPVPEPTTYAAILGSVMLGLGIYRKRRR